MKRLFTLYAIVFSFGMGFGTWKNHTWHFDQWGYNSSKYVSIWWVTMGLAVTAYCLLTYCWNALLKDEQMRIEADNQFNNQ